MSCHGDTASKLPSTAPVANTSDADRPAVCAHHELSAAASQAHALTYAPSATPLRGVSTMSAAMPAIRRARYTASRSAAARGRGFTNSSCGFGSVVGSLPPVAATVTAGLALRNRVHKLDDIRA